MSRNFAEECKKSENSADGKHWKQREILSLIEFPTFNVPVDDTGGCEVIV